jgi:hypothetical protein
VIAPRRLARWLTVALVSAAALFVMARASAARLSWHDRSAARLRLSWRAVPERIEVCRVLSAEELAEREEHMRQRMSCDGRFATYALRVEADGQLLDESVVRGSGLRHDRPLYLLRDFELPGGAHRVRISFTRRERTDADTTTAAPKTTMDADTGLFAGRAGRETVERSRRARAAIPARLVLDTSMNFPPARVTLVTFDADRKAFRLLRANP